MIATLTGCGEAPTVAPDGEPAALANVEESLSLTEDRITVTHDGQGFRLGMHVPDDWSNWAFRYAFLDFEVVAEFDYLSGGTPTNVVGTARLTDLRRFSSEDLYEPSRFHLLVLAPEPDLGEEPVPVVDFNPIIEAPDRAAKVRMYRVEYDEDTSAFWTRMEVPRWVHDKALQDGGDVEVTIEHTYVSGGGATVTTVSQTQLLSELDWFTRLLRPFRTFLRSTMAAPAPDDLEWVNTSVVTTAVP